jgi:hypothetical protein
MPKQEWSINTGAAYAGEQYGLATTNSQRLTYNAEVEMANFGLAVIQGTESNQVKLGAPVAGQILGVTMRQINIESATRPGDGTVAIKPGWPLGVMVSGPIMVKLVTAITDENVGVSAVGQFGGVDATYLAADNVKALRWPAAAGDVIPVMINVLPKA